MTAPAYREVTPLRGRVALHTAAVGALMAAAGMLGFWMVAQDRDTALFLGVPFALPLVALGGFVLALAVLFQFGRAESWLTADPDLIELTYRTRRGWVFKRRTLAVTAVTRLSWVEGDADIRSGLRLHVNAGKDLFLAEDAFDCKAFAAFAVGAYPLIVDPGLVEQVPPRNTPPPITKRTA